MPATQTAVASTSVAPPPPVATPVTPPPPVSPVPPVASPPQVPPATAPSVPAASPAPSAAPAQLPQAKNGSNTLTHVDPAAAASLKQQIETELTRQRNEFSVIKIVDMMIEYATSMGGTDIHIDPTPADIRIRLRIDGILHDSFHFPKILHSILISRIKILTGLRTDEHQIPQDGRFKTLLHQIDPIDIRVSILPTYYGENAKLRLLRSPSSSLSLRDMDFSEADLHKVEHAIKAPYGMILSTGPTGSGKTTMLYTVMKELNKPEVSIITVEDPIEYSMTGIEQIQVNVAANLTFAAGLRSILRQDPNIIMVGEIRDEETAGIAVNAALTGHLLLSTLHTNDAATTLARLSEFKIEPFLVASTVNLAIGQRLVRRICQYCRIEKVISEVEWKSLTESIPAEILGTDRTFYQGKGCDQCGGTGYRGRMGVYEVLVVDDPIREAIMKRANASDIAILATGAGMTTMLQDGLGKAKEGRTTVEEILRVIHE